MSGLASLAPSLASVATDDGGTRGAHGVTAAFVAVKAEDGNGAVEELACDPDDPAWRASADGKAAYARFVRGITGKRASAPPEITEEFERGNKTGIFKSWLEKGGDWLEVCYSTGLKVRSKDSTSSSHALFSRKEIHAKFPTGARVVWGWPGSRGEGSLLDDNKGEGGNALGGLPNSQPLIVGRSANLSPLEKRPPTKPRRSR